MDISTEIARQGLGYLLFIGAVIVLGLREKMHSDKIKEKDTIILDLSEKRVRDVAENRDINSRNIENLRSVIEPIYVIVQNLQNIATSVIN